jgi:uncharacterized protein YkvS
MKDKLIKIISAIAAVVTFSIGLWQFIEWRRERSQNRYDGEWGMTSEIETAQLQRYQGMKMDWVLHLSQIDGKLTGTAEKISENSVKIDFKNRTTLNLQGTIEENKFILTFIEKGKRRETSGVFTGEFSNDKFQGTFSSTASDTKGKISGYKVK